MAAKRTRAPKITARQEGGDDGYCWVIRINGREFVNGLTRTEVPHYKRRAQEAFEQDPERWGGRLN